MTAPARHVYRFLPDLRLAVVGDAGAIRHFDHEYGACLDEGAEDAEVVVDIDGASARRAAARGPATVGGHKSVRWKVALGDAADRPLTTAISLSGWPRSFALSLVQGYFVEALVSLAAPAADHVLLPAAAVVSREKATVLLGKSGTGKSSVSARMLASGGVVIGDDQVLIDRTGRCISFPRRMRFYPDLAETAPNAFRALAPRSRARLRARGVLDRLTAGYVRPSMAIDPRELGAPDPRPSAPVERVLLLEPHAPGRALECESVEPRTALSTVHDVFDHQRARLWSISPPAWRSLINEVGAVEEQILTAAWRQVRLERVRIPVGWSPKQAVDALTELVEAEHGPRAAKPMSTSS
jgi:hypothetical protein